MYRVSDEQIEFILNDIKQRGVEMEDLQLNLLDHICCILEQELKEEKDFETTYQKVIKQFFKHELWEIEEETILLLKYKNYYKMKRFLYILLIASLGFNVYIFARMGYGYYQMRKWQAESEMLKKVTFQEGYQDFLQKLSAQNPNAKKKDFLYIIYPGDLWHYRAGYSISKVVYTSEDSTSLKINKAAKLRILKFTDSIASIYNKNIHFIYAYEWDNDEVDEIIKSSKSSFQNVVFVKDVPKLLSGYENTKNQIGRYSPTTFITDKSGKIVYESNIFMSKPETRLTKFLKSIE